MLAQASPSSVPHSSSSASPEPQRSRRESPTQGNRRADKVTGLVYDLSQALELAVREIHSVNSETKVLALNARIESARAGQFGAAFGVVAEEMQQLSEKTSRIADSMEHRTKEKTSALLDLINSHIRGTRLSDQALMNIDLIDRCLYERTCDVRWWATDSAVVDALTHASEESWTYASHRLGVILDAYTVYSDLVLCDAEGTIVANGRPELYRSKNGNESRSEWFQHAMQTRSGGEFGFQSAHRSPLVDGRSSLIYSAAVRRNADTQGEILGVLGIIFHWDALATPILQKLPQAEENTACWFLDETGKVLATSEVDHSFPIPDLPTIRQSPKGHLNMDHRGNRYIIAFAKAPGFETYTTGWYSVVAQRLP